MSEASERHREYADQFGRVVTAIPDWSAPTPVTEWQARDVVAHLVEWFPAFLSAGGIELTPGPSVETDPQGAWRAHADGVQTLVESRGDEQFTHPYAGTHRLEDAVDRFYTADVFMHTWDLARASGHSVALDEEFAGELLAGMRGMEDVLRGSGQYGAPVAVPVEAPVVDQLMGFIGRDPAWTPR